MPSGQCPTQTWLQRQHILSGGAGYTCVRQAVQDHLPLCREAMLSFSCDWARKAREQDLAPWSRGHGMVAAAHLLGEGLQLAEVLEGFFLLGEGGGCAVFHLLPQCQNLTRQLLL